MASLRTLTTVAGLVALAAMGTWGVAAGQPTLDDGASQYTQYTRLVEVPATIAQIRTLHVTPRGVDPNPATTTESCNIISSHTDANFGGGSFNLQVGMVDGEMFAATYTVPAGEWPIKHNLTEVIFGTSGTVVPTVTQWSILVYQGTPQSGTLVATYSSDGTILPHIELPAGNNGVNLQFSVDSEDPDQIILNDNGSHQFSVAIRIDHLNSPPANPCATAPTRSRNAFMATDVSGLSQPTLNWLSGINCGAFGCPANGGWARFSNLPQACRPTGDWISRTTWSSLSCNPGVGGCCLPNGTCTITTVGDCQAQQGTYRGDGSDCNGAGCIAAAGACCFSNNFCLSLSQVNCAGAGGTWLGANTSCGSGNSCPTGACCLPSGMCITGVTSGQCAAQSGTFRGVGSTCNGANCPQPTGACCLSNGFCLAATQQDCAGIPGSSWAGAFTTCVDANGNGQADICESHCPADFNGDHAVDFFDYDDFVTCFEGAGCPPGKTADFNGDTAIDFFDYDDFVVAFEHGCP